MVTFNPASRSRTSAFSIHQGVVATAITLVFAVHPVILQGQQESREDSSLDHIRNLISLKQEARFKFAYEDFDGLAETLDAIRAIDSEDLALVLYGQILKRHLDSKKLAHREPEPNPFLRMLLPQKPAAEQRPSPPSPDVTPVPTLVAAASTETLTVAETPPTAAATPIVVAELTPAPQKRDGTATEPPRRGPLTGVAGKARSPDPVFWGIVIVSGIVLIWLGLWLLRWSRSGEALPQEGILSDAEPSREESERIVREEVRKPQPTLSDILTVESVVSEPVETPQPVEIVPETEVEEVESREIQEEPTEALDIAVAEVREEEPIDREREEPPENDREEVIISMEMEAPQIPTVEPSVVEPREPPAPETPQEAEPVPPIQEPAPAPADSGPDPYPFSSPLETEDFEPGESEPEEETILVLDDILTVTEDTGESMPAADSSIPIPMDTEAPIPAAPVSPGEVSSSGASSDGDEAPPPPFPIDQDTFFHSDEKTQTHVEKDEETYFHSDAETRAAPPEDRPDSAPGEETETGRKPEVGGTFFGSDDETRTSDSRPEE